MVVPLSRIGRRPRPFSLGVALLWTLFFVVCHVLPSRAEAPAQAGQSPSLTPALIKQTNRAIAASLANGRVDDAILKMRESHQWVVSAYGAESREARESAVTIAEYVELKTLSPEKLEGFIQSFREIDRASRCVYSLSLKEVPSPAESAATYLAIRDASRGMSTAVQRPGIFHVQCDVWHARLLFMTRRFSDAETILKRARSVLEPLVGEKSSLVSLIDYEICRILLEERKSLAYQRQTLDRIVAFAKQEMDRGQYAFRREEWTTQLAETCYLSGDSQTADNLYREVEAALPDTFPSNEANLAYLACGKHAARALMASRNWEGALVKLNHLITVAYKHPVPSQSLRMECLFRMRAEVLRELGREKEAESDERTVKLITDNVARLQAAIAQLSDPNDASQTWPFTAKPRVGRAEAGG
ncbi:MAG: hypothetical protein GYA33_12355 [Thermogutta sp.]|nr:hypothetical protein [Thermogutta sp.]